MFHIFSTPASLLANAVMAKETSAPANIATRQAMELDACMRCGTCSLRCSAAAAFDALGNEYILPTEKMTFLKKLAAGKALGPLEEGIVQRGGVADLVSASGQQGQDHEAHQSVCSPGRPRSSPFTEEW